MGFKLKSIAKGAGIGSLLGVGGMVTGGLLGGSGANVKDFLLGKKKGGFSADEIAGEIRRVQGKGILTAEKGLEKLNKELETDGGDIVRQQIAQQQKGVLTSAQDARRRAQQLMAQRGLKNTSLGLASDRSITQQAGSENASLQSQIPGLVRQQNLADANMLQQAGQGTFGNLGGTAGIRFQGQEGSRSGGLLGVASALAPAAGAIAGGIFGGPAGAQMGGAIGSGVGQATKQPTFATAPSDPNNFWASNPYGK
tara:strand:+ start:8948 stop:9709 length:762 start_codon:yes stop_codon:yes gene_type:complete